MLNRLQGYLLVVLMPVLLTGGLTEGENATKETLYVLVQLPYPIPNSAGLFPSWTDGPDIKPVLSLATRQINERTDLLPSYNLELEHINGGCDYVDGTAVTNLAESVGSLVERKDRRYVALIGPGCSGSTFVVGPLTNRSHLNMITIHGAGASVFSDRESYPYYFGTLGSVEEYAELTVALMRITNWRKVAILFHDVRLYFATLTKEVVAAVSREFVDAEIVFTSMVQRDFYPLTDLKSTRARIIYVFAPLEHLQQILCLAYHSGMVYPAYQWVLPIEVTLAEFITKDKNVSFYYDHKHYECSVEHFEAALNNSFFMNYRLIPLNMAAESVAGLNYTEYYELYQQEIGKYNNNRTNPFRNVTTTIWAAYFYDSLWALAIALHNVTEKHHLNLSEYRYKDENITQLIAEELYNVDFNGNSGPISFREDTGFVVREIDLFQIINYTEVFTMYSNGGHIITLREFDFINDEFEIRNAPAYRGVAALFGTITSILLLMVVTLHILTVVYRNHSSVKASSPNLNQIAYVGIYLLVIELLLSCISEDPGISNQVRAAFCQAGWAWFLPISFTLALGPVVVRTWRLYRIFIHYLEPGPFISTPVLVTIISVMFSVDLIIAIVWTTIDPFRLDELESTVRDGGVSFLAIRLGCRCDYYFVWFGVIMLYKISTLIVMSLLAVLTRPIKNQSFTTASLRVFGYLMTIVFVLGFSVYYFFSFVSFDPNLELSAFSITLNLMLLAYIVCVFLPPLLLPLREKFKGYSVGKIELKPIRKDSYQRKFSADSRDILM